MKKKYMNVFQYEAYLKRQLKAIESLQDMKAVMEHNGCEQRISKSGKVVYIEK